MEKLSSLKRVGIKVIWQAFNPEKVIYPQIGNDFLGNLSIIDCLINAGARKDPRDTSNSWKP